ncbi:MAG: magnesium transporter [Clostridia bacterium]|nr:magnesium transporter [Clostridia bacterium]
MMELNERILQLLRERKFSELKPIAASMNEVDLAEVFEELDTTELPILFRILPKDLAAAAFAELDRDTKETLIHKLTDFEIRSVMDELFLDDTVDLIEEMPANVVKRILSQSDKETRKYINDILKYPRDSAGSIMTIEYISLHSDMTVAEAFEKIRKKAIDSETIYTCYVTDNVNRLIGLVTAKKLMLSPKDITVGDIMDTNVIYSYTTDDREEVALKLTDYRFLALPIVDAEMRLVGIVTVDDAIDVIREETTEDIAKMAATASSDVPYLKTSVFEIWKNRIPWLLILMVSGTFTSLILNVYESRLNAISSVLFACVPMIMGTGGNCGSQASVTVIRSMSLGQLEGRDVLKVLLKELRASILLGVTLAAACFVKLILLDNMLFGFDGYTPVRCAVVSAALLLTVVLAKIVGCSLPFIAKLCRLDPAVVASPFITTIVDVLSLMIYCMLAIAVLA